MSAPGQHRRRPIRYGVERLIDTLLMDGKVAAWSYRRGWHGNLGITRHALALDAAQRLPAPLVIAFASDLHAGPTTHPALFDALAHQLEAARPDVVLLGGDYVSLGARHIAQLRGLFARAAELAPLGAYAVMGNHDIWHGREPIQAALQDAGVHVLVNRNLALPAPFDMVSICGVDDPWTGAPSPRAAFAGAAPVRIYLMHSPDGMCNLAETFDVGFAGHTHGGQIAFANGTPVRRPRGPLSRDHCYGRYEFANGPLIVSRGIGCSALPLRINADPELVLCTLQ
ncbi:metallophosphoesterase [Massilia agilis]|uniref:Metallophosphoesterase n=1 Tax=Massilia agilis TaxID=1811226 RepID=A0ABT2D582_9BURK|nr:metallophosphoesterase [Massilia agilis]MCS0806469.1 metallophosphoesterase [Massilia agilis]